MHGARKKWIAAATGSAALAVIVAGAMLRHRPRAPAGLPVASGAPRAHPPGSRAASTAAEARNATRTARTDAVEVEICGRGKVLLDRSDDFAAIRFLEATTKPAWERWLAAMLNSDDTRARAAGLLLQGKIGNGGLVGNLMTEQSRDELVQLAAGAGDPAVYAMAVYACGTLSVPLGGSCSRISLSAWAALDPGNAVPWLALAAAARSSHDVAGEAVAFARAASADSFQAYNFSLLAFAEPELPKETTPLERAYFSAGIMGVMAALPSPGNGVESKHCSGDSTQHPAVHQGCSALAELMVSKGTTVVDLSVGTNLGERLGWPKPRVEALRQERDALMGAIVQAAPDSKDPWSCKSVARHNAYMGRFTALGEVAAAREALERSGEDVLEVSRRPLDASR